MSSWMVVVMQHGTGLDDWMRSVADQIAHEGFIAVDPDIWSGTGPNGGGRDSFQFDDDAMKAAARIGPAETQRRYKAAWEWAMKLPRANGKSGTPWGTMSILLPGTLKISCRNCDES